MSIKSFFAIPFAKIATRKVFKWAEKPHKTQEKVFKHLLSEGGKTAFGKDHNFKEINSYHDFKSKVPLRTYEDLQPYINRITQGEESVLWPGKPLYLAKTSGTTAGTKYIPITKDSMPTHIKSARNAMLLSGVCIKKSLPMCWSLICVQSSAFGAGFSIVKLWESVLPMASSGSRGDSLSLT